MTSCWRARREPVTLFGAQTAGGVEAGARDENFALTRVIGRYSGRTRTIWATFTREDGDLLVEFVNGLVRGATFTLKQT